MFHGVDMWPNDDCFDSYPNGDGMGSFVFQFFYRNMPVLFQMTCMLTFSPEYSHSMMLLNFVYKLVFCNFKGLF